MDKLMALALVGVALTLVMVYGPAGCTSTCKGDDLKRTHEIIHDAYDGGVRLAASNEDILTKMNKMADLIRVLYERAAKLPAPCQELVERWGKSFPTQSGGASGAQCVAGVCCDSRGCVGS